MRVFVPLLEFNPHLLHEVGRQVTVEKSCKGRRVYVVTGFGIGPRELRGGEIYVDPATHVLMRYPAWRS